MAIQTTIILYWLTATRADFAKPSDWRNWADKLIIAMDKPPSWIIDMALATETKDLEKLFGDVIDKLPANAPTEAAMDDVVIGYIWWKFEMGKISLKDCLKLAGEAADASCSRLSCESMFELLNKLESKSIEAEVIEAHAKELLGPLQQVAREQWSEIQACI